MFSFLFGGIKRKNDKEFHKRYYTFLMHKSLFVSLFYGLVFFTDDICEILLLKVTGALAKTTEEIRYDYLKNRWLEDWGGKESSLDFSLQSFLS